MKNHDNTENAFTRLDLIFTVATIAALGILAAVKSFAAQGASCTSNKAQLVRALHLYAADNGDFLPLMTDSGTLAPNSIWLAHYNGTLPDATNAAKLINPSYSQLAPYLNGQASVFKCPANTAQFNVGGKLVTRVRDISMSQAVGTNPQAPGAKKATDGPWLDGTHSHLANQIFRTYARLGDIVNPRPANLFVFLDEHPDSINDSTFACAGPHTTPTGYSFIDFPATFHSNGGGFGFADGHGEIHVWSSTIGSPTKPATGSGVQIDLDWLARHTTARVTEQP